MERLSRPQQFPFFRSGRNDSNPMAKKQSTVSERATGNVADLTWENPTIAQTIENWTFGFLTVLTTLRKGIKLKSIVS